MKPRYFNYFGAGHVNETKSDSTARNGSAQHSFRLNRKGIQEFSTSHWIPVTGDKLPNEIYNILVEDPYVKACGWGILKKRGKGGHKT